MILTTQTEALRGVLESAARAAGRTTPDILLTADADTLTVQATDGEVSLSGRLAGVEVETPGSVLAPAVLLDILKASTGGVRLALTASILHVHANGKYQLPTGNVRDFPEVDLPTGEATLTIAADELATLISRTAFAAADDDGKFAMRGVLWEAGKGLTLAATDSHRLAVASLNVASGDQTVIVPPKAMALLATLCKGTDAVRVWLPSKGLAHFATDAAHLASRLVDGRFPPFRDVLPKKSAVVCKVPLTVGPFLLAVRQAALMADEESKRIEFAFGERRCVLTAQGSTTGQAEVPLSLPDYAGSDIRISLDPKLLVEMLRTFDSEDTLTLELIAPDRPAVFRAKDFSYLCVPLC